MNPALFKLSPPPTLHMLIQRLFQAGSDSDYQSVHRASRRLSVLDVCNLKRLFVTCVATTGPYWLL